MYGKDTVDFDEVVASLISHETLRRKEIDETFGERVMVASNNGYPRGRSMERRDDSRQSSGRSQSRVE